MRTAQHLSLSSSCSTSYGAGLPACSRQLRPRMRAPCRAVAEATEASVNMDAAPLVVVKSVPPPRAPAAPPQPVAIEHSSAFLLRSRREGSESESEQQQPARRRAAADGAFEGNAVMWALKKADESLDEIEENPPEYAKTIYEISRGPVGTAASKGVTTAAKVTMQVGGEVLKAAAPVGKWALKQGFKLAVTAVSKGIEAGLSSGSSKDKNSKKK